MEDSVLICGLGSALLQDNDIEDRHTDQYVNEDDGQGDAGPILGLQFVAETGVARPKGTLREIIRSQARRKRPSRRHNSGSKRVTSLRSSNKWGKQEEVSDSIIPCSSAHLTLRDATPSPDRGPAGKFDPFHSLPIDERGDSHFLLSQLQGIFSPDNLAYSCAIRKEDVMSFTITDSALLHAALALSALTLCNAARIDSSPEMVYHAGQAISLVNKRIANSSQEVISDATMFAVGVLTQYEIRTLAIRSIKIHMDGLEALVRSRGGIQTLADNPLILRFLYWTDSVACIAMDTKPRFELAPFPPQNNPANWEPYSHLALRYQTKLCNLTGLPDLSQETIEVYWGLRNLTATKDLVSASLKPAIPRGEFYVHTGQLVGRLINIVQYDIPDSLNHSGLIYRLFGNAALAHVVMFLRDHPLRHSFGALLSARIRKDLEMINVASFQLQYPEMLLWILMISGFGSIGTDNQWWYAKLVAESCLATGIAKTTEIAFFLTEFFWTDSYLYPLYTEFWDDVVVAVEGGNTMSRVVDETDGLGSD